MDSTVSSAAAALSKRLDLLAGSLRHFNEALSSNPHNVSLINEAKELQQTAEKCASIKDNLSLGTVHAGLDKGGTCLWNSTTALMRGADDALKEVSLEARVLACYALDCSWARGVDTEQDIARLFKVAVKTAKMLLESDRLTMSAKIFERAAKFHEVHSAADPDGQQDPESSGAYIRSMSDFLICRMNLAWKQSTLGAADALFAKAEAHFAKLTDVTSIEKFVDALLKIGKDLMGQNVHDRAVLWLKRAYDVINKIDAELIVDQGQELQLGIMHNLVRAYIARKGEGDFSEAHAILERMDADWPQRIVVHLSKLDLLELENNNDHAEYYRVVKRMCTIVILNETVLHAAISKIHILASKNIAAACDCIDQMLRDRILKLNNDEWTEQLFITRLWITVQDPKILEEASMKTLASLLDAMEMKLSKPLSSKVTHSSQILLWKVSQAFFVQGRFEECAAWCKTMLHSIFDKSSAGNIGKISRRLITCYLNLKGYDEARSAFDAMPPSEKDSVPSQFLLFKLSLRVSDDEEAIKCIERMCDQPNPDKRAIYACVMDAEEVDNKRVVHIGLRKVIDNLERMPSDSAHIPTLLRCSISLTITEMESYSAGMSQDLTANAESMCQIFEKCAEQAKKSRLSRSRAPGEDVQFKIEELEWFSRAAYNLSLRSIDEWGEVIALRLLRSCLNIILLFPNDADTQTRQDINIRMLHCHYLIACLKIELARKEQEIDAQEELFMDVSDQATEFKKLWTSIHENLPEPESTDLRKKYGTILILEFEARSCMKSWDALGAIVDAGELCADSKVFECLGDMTLRSKAPHRTMIALLRKILQHSMQTGQMNLTKVAAFLRCQLQIAMINDPKTTETLVKQIVAICKGGRVGSEYPRDEIHWVSATLWNRAIDYHSVADKENFQKFGEMAMTVAGLLGGEQGIGYVKGLQENFIRMGMEWEKS